MSSANVMNPLPSGSELSAMTFWPRCDPAVTTIGSTDHWSKMRTRATGIHFPTQEPIGGPLKLPPLTRSKTFTAECELHKPNFDETPEKTTECIQTTRVSGDYTQSMPRTTIRRDDLGSAYNKRAKEGFRYWLIGRPKPTSFGKYGMGSYKTVLGIGNAPRT